MASFFSLFVGLPIFLTLPGPVKFFLMMLTGLSFFSGRQAEVVVLENAQAVVPFDAPAPLDAAPELVVPKIAINKVTEPLKIIMDINGEFTMNGEEISKAALATKLKTMVKASAQQKVMLEADARAPLQVITDAMKTVKSAGFTNVTVSPSDPPELR